MKNNLIDSPETTIENKEKELLISGKPPVTWSKLQKQFSKTDRLKKIAKLFGGDQNPPLLWLMSQRDMPPDAQLKITRWHESLARERKVKSTLSEMLETAKDLPGSTPNVENGVVALAIAGALRVAGTRCSEDEWWQLLDSLFQFSNAYPRDSTEEFLSFQIRSIELPLTLAFMVPEVKPLVASSRDAIERMSTCVSPKLDGDGIPHASCFFQFGPLAASWSRCTALVRELKLSIDKETRMQLEWVVRQIVRMSRFDRTILGGNVGGLAMSDAFTKTLLAMSTDDQDKRLMAACVEGDRLAAKSSFDLEESSVSEWGEIGILQCDWRHGTPKVGVNFSNRKCWLEIARRESLIVGDCTPLVSIDGKLKNFDGELEVTGWISDELVDYLELSVDLEGGGVLERQILLAREDHFLLINDTVIAGKSAKIGYSCKFPFAAGISGLEETETREVYLQNPAIHSLVLPLALPEWKVARTNDRFTIEEDGLLLSQEASGEGLFSGMFFDLKPTRSVQPRTWRRLTIAEKLEPVALDQAVAFRIQIGDDQWVFYQTVSSLASRTFIGENTVDDFFIGRFDSDGDVEELLRIE